MIITHFVYAEESFSRFATWRTERPSASTPEVLEELRSLQTCSSLGTGYRAAIFLGAVFTDKAVSGNAVRLYKDVLKGLGSTPIQQRQLIAAFEWFCGVHLTSLARYFPVVLKQLFDEDIVEEDVFLSWDADPIFNDYSLDASIISEDVLESLRESAKPFITWLQEAEEEGEDEEAVEEDD